MSPTDWLAVVAFFVLLVLPLFVAWRLASPILSTIEMLIARWMSL